MISQSALRRALAINPLVPPHFQAHSDGSAVRTIGVSSAVCSLIVWVWDPSTLKWRRYLLAVRTLFFDSFANSFVAETVALRMASELLVAVLSPEADWPEEWCVQITE